ncbi:MAG: LysR substrate-binding domain-containing protein [Pseudomonadota bacterium]
MAKPSITNLPLNPLRTFAIASRHKSFTDAARQIGVSQVAVGRQITVLEDYLGVKLFERGVRSVKITEAGRAFGQDISVHFDRLEKAAGRMLTKERERTINLRIYPTLSHYWLLPNLPKFQSKYPDYIVRLDTALEELDFRGTYLDVAFQLGHGNWPDTQCIKANDEIIDAVCSPAYADRFDGFRDPASLSGAVLLHSRFRRNAWEIWSTKSDVEVNHLSGLEFDTSLLAYTAAINGIGVAMGQVHLLREEIEKGRLVRPFNRGQRTGDAFYVAWPKTRSVARQTRHLIDWLMELSRDNNAR